VRRARMPDLLSTYDQLKAEISATLRPDLATEEFEALALRIHAFQRQWNEPYARFCATRATPSRWQEIPAVPQSAFKRARLSCVPAERITKTFRTSGTTGETRGEHHFADTDLYEAALLAGWRAQNFPRWRQVIFALPPEDAPHSSLSHMFATLAEESSEPQTWVLDAEGQIDFAALATALTDPRPVALLGTALAFLNFFEQTPTRWELPAGSFTLETGGYKGSGRSLPKAELYALFTQRCGLDLDSIWNEYGMTELSSQGYTHGLKQAHHTPPWLHTAIIDPTSGTEVAVNETGVLRLFDLANLNSVLAIETQDLAIRRATGFDLLGRDPAALPRGCSRTVDELLRRP